MSLEAHLAELKRRHRALEAEIAEAGTHPSIDNLEIVELKRRKLLREKENRQFRIEDFDQDRRDGHLNGGAGADFGFHALSNLLRSNLDCGRDGSSCKNGSNSMSLKSGTAGVEISGAILGPAAFLFRLEGGAITVYPACSELLHRQRRVPRRNGSRRPPADATCSAGHLVGRPSRI